MTAKNTEKQDTKTAAQKIEFMIGNINAKCIDAELINVSDGCIVSLSKEAMAIALDIDRPSIVFRNTRTFDLEELIRSEILSAGGRASSINRRNMVTPTMEECIEIVPLTDRQRSGQPYRTIYAYAKEGLTRACIIYAEWHENIVDLVEVFIEGHEERFQKNMAKESAKPSVLFEQLIKEIANDDRFVRLRGLRKKGLLVQAIWGERIPLDPQNRVTRLAQGDDLQDWNFVHVVRQANDIVDQKQMMG